jgi:hypothetical protein
MMMQFEEGLGGGEGAFSQGFVRFQPAGQVGRTPHIRAR